jgi:hypothetical protein
MGLGLPVTAGGGDFKPIVKYDARAGRVHRIDRADGVSTPVEITQGFAAVFDLANIEVGYVMFNEGGAPAWAMVKIGQPLPQKPSKDYKTGFRLNIKLSKSLGGEVREFASAAGCVISAMDALYESYSKAPESAAGKLPVVSIPGTTMIKSGSGQKTSTNYAPNFAITAWVDRPADLTNLTPTAASPAASNHGQAPMVAPPISTPTPMQTPSAASVATEF